MDEDDDYAQFLADYIMAYLVQQQAVGRKVVAESEIWQILGQPFPEDRVEQIFDLDKYVEVKSNDNVTSLDDFRNKKKSMH